MKSTNRYNFIIGALLLAAGLKIVLIFSRSVPLNGDEAVVSLMARHILQGERPIFFYGQAYMGSLDAWLVALGFRLFGEGVTAVRIVQSSLYLIYLVTLWGFARRLYNEKMIANLAVLIAAVPPVLVTTYTTATLGGYGESLILGNLILWLGYEVTHEQKKERWWHWLALGLVGGIAFWVLGIAGVYLLPVGLVGLWRFDVKRIRYYILAGAGFILGGSAWWLYNLNHNWEALLALSGPESVGFTIFDRMLGMLLLGFPALLGLRMPWSPEFFPLPLLLIGLILYIALAAYKLRIAKFRDLDVIASKGSLLVIFVIGFVGIFVVTNYGIDATGRYLLPMYLVLVLYLAEFSTAVWRKKKEFGIAIVGVVMLLHLGGTWLAATSPDKITTQFDAITSFDNSFDDELMEFLVDHGETIGYSNYWVAYRIAFLSKEEIIFSPEIPYKPDLSYTTKDNRYPAYAEMADSSEQVAYITTKHPELDEDLRAKFEAMGVSYLEEQIGEFHIFYDLSRAVRPEELGYGEVAP